mmetsp:Transcript_52305/g.124798  ORF Transcript_52305/g.124798 Transcript_52305/m.124798 type:complete len:760 (+) Transcript_52305:99-2378(+)
MMEVGAQTYLRAAAPGRSVDVAISSRPCSTSKPSSAPRSSNQVGVVAAAAFSTQGLLFATAAASASARQRRGRRHGRRMRQAVALHAAAEDDFGLPPKLAKTMKAMQALPNDRIRYQQLLALASKLPAMAEEEKIEANKVPGCLSTVHVSATLKEDGTVELAGDSDAVMSKGLVALLILGLTGCTPAEVERVQPEFIKACGISASLSPGRNNGFFNMLNLIKRKVADFSSSESSAPAAAADAEDAPSPAEGKSKGSSADSMKIYNTLTRSKEPFRTENEGVVNMYVCGVTVYDLCHLGHARVMVFFDLVVRFLERQGYKVNYVRNITDVDDKIIKRSAELGEEPDELVDRMIAEMHKDCASLGCRPPTVEPKATEHISEMIDFIKQLIEKEHAYSGPEQEPVPVAEDASEAPRDVYFRVKSFPKYGRLSRRNLEGDQAGARIDVTPGKEEPEDFALWKGAKRGEPFWATPWGPGRPGWHIECSTMAKKHLGETLDIHGGGPDLIFPHHENEIAQSEALHCGRTYAHTWMHCAPVRSLGGEKMSKSLGNFVTIRDILDRGIDGEALRFYLLSSQYRQPLLYTDDALVNAQERLLRLYSALRSAPSDAGDENSEEVPEDADQWQRFVAAMRNDFDTVTAISVMSEVARELLSRQVGRRDEASSLSEAQLAALLRGMGSVLGLLQRDPEQVLRGGSGTGEGAADDEFQSKVEALVEERNAARKSRDFQRADDIRDELASLGVVLEDTQSGTTWRVGAPVATG